MPVQINWWLSPPSYDPPSPIWNCQSTESTLHCPMSPMRAHLKQSTNKNISGKEISPLPPFHHNFTDLIFRCSGLPAHTADCPPPYMSLSVPIHCLCKVISKDLLWTSINRYISLHRKTYWEKHQFYCTATCTAIAGVYIEREITAQSDLTPPEHTSMTTTVYISQIFSFAS